MTANRATKAEPAAPDKTDPLGASLEYLRLPYIREQYTA